MKATHGGFIANQILRQPLGFFFLLGGLALGGATAFGRYNGRPLIVYMNAGARFFLSDNKYIWKQVPTQVKFVDNSATSKKSSAETNDTAATIAETEQKLAEIAKLLDQ